MLERPVILVVDDEPTALASMLDALTRRFGGDYRVEPHLSAQSALDAVSVWKKTFQVRHYYVACIAERKGEK